MSNNNLKDWIHADSYIPADEYRERLKLWSMGWRWVLIQGSTPFQLYTDDNDLIPNKTKKIPTVRTGDVESFISTMSHVDKAHLRAILKCPDTPPKKYSSDDEMLIDQLLRNLGIFDYCTSKDFQQDFELEEVKKRWPIGTKYRVKDVRGYPDIYTVKEVIRSDHGSIFIDDKWFETSIEKVDTELEETKNKFASGWFQWLTDKTAHKITDIRRGENGYDEIYLHSGRLVVNAKHCTPFTFPTQLQWKSVSEPPDSRMNVLLNNGGIYFTAYYNDISREWRLWTGTTWTGDFNMFDDAQWTELPK